MKLWIVYYSLSGNTKRIAEQIRETLGGDLSEIETIVPYTGDYNAVVAQGEEEIRRGFMPEIRPFGARTADYDTVILCTPVWWYTFAPAVKTFLAGNDLAGKTVYPFATNGGWIGHTFKDIEKACPDATVKKGLNVRFDGNTLRTDERTIREWIEAIRG